jgi:hypothetical protein
MEKGDKMNLQYRETCISSHALKFCRDLKIIKDKIIENWWRMEGHRVDVRDVTDILAASPEALVVGTGYAGFMEVSKSLHSTLEKRNIQLIAEKTHEAVKIFNELHGQGKKVAGAFHLTC